MSKGLRILIVDDDEEIVCGLSVRLRAAGYETRAAYNGADAISGLRRTRPDAILLDVRMPDMDGLAVLKKLQEASESRRVPVIMLSASLTDERQALNAGARFFLPKPYRGSELLQVLKQVLTYPDSHQPAETCPTAAAL